MSYSQADQAAQRADKAGALADALAAQKAAGSPTFQQAQDTVGAAGAKSNVSGPTTFENPGSADVGGSPDAAAWYKRDAQGHMGDNDAQQKSNDLALGNSLHNMMGNRGPQSAEDAALSGRAASTREQQLRALALQRDAAQGGAPSAAAFQTTQGMNDVMGGRAGALGGAHGLAGLTGAQVGSAATAGGVAGNVAAQGGMGRSKEIGDALGMYGSNSGAVRQQDIQRLGIADQNSKFNAQNDTSWRLGNANLAAAQGGLSVGQRATDQGWFDQSMQPEARQFGYDQEMAAAQNGADADKAAASIAAAREANDHARGLVQGGTSAGLTAIGSMAGPAGTAAGAGAGAGINTATNDWWK
jgi:hypothetical protein